MDRRTMWIAACLGCICLIGPCGIDMYLGALPAIGRDLGASGGSIQLSVTSYFLGFTLGQLFYGPVSDRTGRKPMVYLALALYAVSSAGCAFAANAQQLAAWRFAQGLGGSIGMVVSAAVIRDLYSGATAASLMSMVVMILGLSPILAPLAGSLILKAGHWRVIFGAMAGLGVAALALIHVKMPETRSRALRGLSHPGAALKQYRHFLVSRHFIPYAGTLALVQGGFFAYMAGSSFVLIKLHGLSPLMYSVLFSVNAIGLALGSFLSVKLMGRFGAHGTVKGATLAFAAGAVLLLALDRGGASGLGWLCSLLFFLVTAVGCIMPACNLLTMEAHEANSGAAAALMGALGFGAGAVASALIGAFRSDGALPMILIMAICGILATLVAHTTNPGPVLAEVLDPDTAEPAL